MLMFEEMLLLWSLSSLLFREFQVVSLKMDASPFHRQESKQTT